MSKNSFGFRLSLIFSVITAFFVAGSAATKPDASFKGTAFSYGKIYDIALQPDGKKILAGKFIETNGSSQSQNIVRLNTDNSTDASFSSQTNNEIRKIIIQADGKIIIGGLFQTVRGVARNGLARLNADGSLDNSYLPAAVYGNFSDTSDILLQSDGKILVIGNGFSPGIVRLNTDGSRDSSFSVGLGPRIQTAAGTIEAANLQPDGKILVTGTFDTFNITSRLFLARLNADGSVDPSFDSGTGATKAGKAVLVSADGKILWATEGSLLRFNTGGTVDGTFITGLIPQSRINLLQQTDGKIIVSSYRYFGDAQDGNFDSEVLRINSNGARDPSFTLQTLTDSIVFKITLQNDGKLLVGGKFYTVGGLSRIGILQTETNGTLNTAFNPILKDRGTISDLALQPDGKIIVGGSFYEINGVLRNNLARLNPGGTPDLTFNANVESLVDSPPYFTVVKRVVRTPDNKILVGGRFYRVNGANKGQIVRLNSDGSTDNSFNLPADTVISSFQFYPLVVQADGKVLTNGGSLAAGSSSWRIIRLNPNGAVDPSFTSIRRGLAAEIGVQSNGNIIAGGFFFNPLVDLIRLKPNGTIDVAFTELPFAGGLNVTSLAVQSDDSILVGRYTGNRLIRLSVNGAVDTSFNPNFSNGSGFPEVWRILPQPNGKVIIGGDFRQVNGFNRESLVRLNRTGGVDLSFNPNGLVKDGFILALGSQPTGNLVFGGGFNRPNSLRQDLGRILNSSAPSDFDGDGLTDFGVFRPSDGIWYYLPTTAASNFSATRFGLSGDQTVAADFDGDGKTDIAVFRPSDGNWYILQSSDNQVKIIRFGLNGDIPATADFDADGKSDIAVFRNGTWYIINSADNSVGILQFGLSGDIPVAGDFDGDGKADIAVFRNGVWYVLRSLDGGVTILQFGISNDVPVRGDFDGDGKQDFTVFRNGVWYILKSADASVGILQFGLTNDIPTVGDYDGDNRSDISVWRSTDRNFYVYFSESGTVRVQNFGLTNDLPTAGANY